LFCRAHGREKRFLLPAIFGQLRAVPLGVSVCYFWLLPKTILFFFREPSRSAWRHLDCGNSIILRDAITIGFGLAFELPVVWFWRSCDCD